MLNQGEASGGETGRPPALVYWRPVFAGAVIGLGLFVLLSLLWTALAFGSGVSFFGSTLSWWIGASAIVSFFVGAYLAGWLGGVGGWGPGLLNGVTMWGLLVIASTAVGLPALLGSLHVIPTVRAGTSLWATFWSVLIALVTAAIGGAAGGSTPRSAAIFLPATRGPRYGAQNLGTSH